MNTISVPSEHRCLVETVDGANNARAGSTALTDERKTTVAGSPEPRLQEPQLPVLRFGLRNMFWWVTGLCVLLAALAALPRGMAAVALLLAVAVVVLHVSSTAIGHRLREHADERRTWEARSAATYGPPRPNPPPVAVLPTRRSPLHGREQPLRRIRLCLTTGATVGGLLGLVVLSAAIGDRTSWAGILVGAASTAVVGAWLAFVGASAWCMFRQGWRDAIEDEQRE